MEVQPSNAWGKCHWYVGLLETGLNRPICRFIEQRNALRRTTLSVSDCHELSAMHHQFELYFLPLGGVMGASMFLVLTGRGR